MGPPILPLLEIRHETVHDPWFGCEEVDCFDISIRRPSIGDLLDVWSKSGEAVPDGVWAVAYS